MDDPLGRFAELARVPEAEIDLALAALTIARIEHPGLQPAPSLETLDDLAARSGVGNLRDPRRGLDRLREFLFGAAGFRGNADDYYDPRNSCLNDVLDRRVGIPITLSLVMMEVGRRAGLPIIGIGLPGHFIAAADLGTEWILFDPFNGGTVLTRAGAARVVSQALGRRVKLEETHFAPASKRQMLCRLLANLKAVYLRHETWDKALAVIDGLLALNDASRVHLRDRGSVLVRLGQIGHGVVEWERYLTRYPHASDAPGVRRDLRRVRQRLASMN